MLPSSVVGTAHLQSLAHELEETSSLCVLEGQDILYVERVAAPRLHLMNVSIGNRLPAWATSMGRVLIAQLAEAEQESFLERVQLKRYTEHTVAELDALRRELDTVRDQGWSLVNQELDEGLRGLAVPVYRKNQLLGALNISVQAGRNNPEAIKQILLPKLREAATAIADDFGGRLA